MFICSMSLSLDGQEVLNCLSIFFNLIFYIKSNNTIFISRNVFINENSYCILVWNSLQLDLLRKQQNIIMLWNSLVYEPPFLLEMKFDEMNFIIRNSRKLPHVLAMKVTSFQFNSVQTIFLIHFHKLLPFIFNFHLIQS